MMMPGRQQSVNDRHVPSFTRYARLLPEDSGACIRMKSDLLDERLLRRLAGDAAYERGCRYHAEGRVKHLQHETGRARARVSCGERLWRELAGDIEANRSLETIDIYKRLVRHTVGLSNNKAYSEAILLIRHIHKLMQAAQQT